MYGGIQVVLEALQVQHLRGGRGVSGEEGGREGHTQTHKPSLMHVPSHPSAV